MITSAIAALLALITLVAARGFRRTLPSWVAVLGLGCVVAITFAGRHVPIAGIAPSSVLGGAVGIACLLGSGLYAIFVFTRRRDPMDLPKRWAIGLVTIPVLAYAIVHGRDRPDPTRLADCARANLPASIRQGDFALDGPVLDSSRGWIEMSCALELRERGTIVATIPMSRPWGVSGGRMCGHGEAVLCRDLAIVYDEPAEPTTSSSVTLWRLRPTLVATTGIAAGNDRWLAFPLGFEVLAGAGAIVLALGLVGKRRVASMPAMGAYRTSELAEPKKREGMHAAAIVWMIASAPLVAAVLGSLFGI